MKPKSTRMDDSAGATEEDHVVDDDAAIENELQANTTSPNSRDRAKTTDEYDTKHFKLGSLSQRSSKYIEEGSDPKQRFQTLADAYYSYALMATFVFGFSISLFTGEISSVNDTLDGIYGIFLSLTCGFSGYCMVLLGTEYYMYILLLGRRDYNALVDIKQYNFKWIAVAEYALWFSVYCLLFAAITRCFVFKTGYAIAMVGIILSAFLLIGFFGIRTSNRFRRYRRDKL